MTMWGIHNDTELDLLAGNFVSIGWDLLGDLRQYDGREALKTALKEAYPGRKQGSYPVQAGVLYSFSRQMSVGDVVVAPNKADRTVNVGVVSGDYYFDPSAPLHKNRRPVQWVKTGASRTTFSLSALNEIGSAITLFRVRRNADEFRDFLESPTESEFQARAASEAEAPEVAAERADEALNADRLDQYTRDFIAKRLLTAVGDREFEELTGDLMRTLGYRARVTRYSNDGGVDVIAHRDPFGLEPPIVKVQCKHTVTAIGGPAVAQLVGRIGTTETGLFVTLGTYTPDAIAQERNNPRLRLLTGDELIDLILQHYDELPRRWRDVIPLRRVFVVDEEPGVA
ncbi:restriction endonuclease [Leifsonia sp. ku-ls]|nr:restriction endonuclease [Leifsonia sp. ku-ls]